MISLILLKLFTFSQILQGVPKLLHATVYGRVNEDNWQDTPEHNDTIKGRQKLGQGTRGMKWKQTQKSMKCDNC